MFLWPCSIVNKLEWSKSYRFTLISTDYANDVIISVINKSINSFQFNSYAVLPGKILCKIPAFYGRHLAASCHFNLKERQSFWPHDTLFRKENFINMQIRNNFWLVLAQRTNSQNLRHSDWVSNFLWILKEFDPILCLNFCHKRL